MDFRVLGPLEVRVREDVVSLRAGLPRKLLVTLVLRLGEWVSIDALADVLWRDDPPDDPVNALQILMSHLRKALSASDEPVALERVGKGYRLLAPRETVDAYRVEAVAVRARQVGDAATRLAELDAALAQWRGSPIPEVASEEFAQADLRPLLELRLALMEQRVDALLDLRRHADAALDLQGLIVEHPLRERFYAQLMTALYRSGRQTEALQVYGSARSTLVEELGLDPSPELQAMEQAVLTHSPALQPPTRPNPETPQPPDEQGEASVTGWSPAAYPRSLDVLIGRQRELARLTGFLTSRRWVTLTGPGGAGKTRLRRGTGRAEGGCGVVGGPLRRRGRARCAPLDRGRHRHDDPGGGGRVHTGPTAGPAYWSARVGHLRAGAPRGAGSGGAAAAGCAGAYCAGYQPAAHGGGRGAGVAGASAIPAAS